MGAGGGTDAGDGADGRSSVLVLGEALVDLVRRDGVTVEEAPGGSPANVAVALARLGVPARLLTALGDDERGERVRRWLRDAGVIVDAVAAPRTATATAHLQPDGSAVYEFDIAWDLASARIEVAERIVHTGSIASLMGPGAEVVRSVLAAARSTALVTYDPNIRPSLLHDRAAALRGVDDIVALADVVKASDEDLRWLHPDRDPLVTARNWVARGAGLVVVTAGSAGATAVTADATVSVPGREVEVVDTVGAGDTFMGALICGLRDEGLRDATHREDLRRLDADAIRRLLDLGATAAAVTVSRRGADPPRRSELEVPEGA